MWRPDRRLVGPTRATPADIDELNSVFSDAFTDRYRRDGLVGVRVPHLNPLIWRYAIEDAGEGALLWRDAAGDLVGFNMVHRSGTEGWMGPIAVRPDRQGEGLGVAMVRSGISWLQGQSVRTIGLETMPRTIDNIGFYSRIGFAPAHLTVTLVKERVALGRAQVGLLSSLNDVGRVTAECARLTDRLVPGLDFTREISLTLGLELGDVVLTDRGSELTGFALCHSAPLAQGRSDEELRVLKLVAGDDAAFANVVQAVEAWAHKAKVARVAIRCQSAYAAAYHQLFDLGYRVHWTDLRMTLRAFGEHRPAGGVVYSNWEI